MPRGNVIVSTSFYLEGHSSYQLARLDVLNVPFPPSRPLRRIVTYNARHVMRDTSCKTVSACRAAKMGGTCPLGPRERTAYANVSQSCICEVEANARLRSIMRVLYRLLDLLHPFGVKVSARRPTDRLPRLHMSRLDTRLQRHLPPMLAHMRRLLLPTLIHRLHLLSIQHSRAVSKSVSHTLSIQHVLGRLQFDMHRLR